MMKVIRTLHLLIQKSTYRNSASSQTLSLCIFFSVFDKSEDETGKENLQTTVPKTEIERLNLSNLTSNHSGLDSDRTVTPHGHEHPVISSVRSEQTVPQSSARVPFQDYENIKEPVCDKLLPYGKFPDEGTQLLLNSDLNAEKHAGHFIGQNNYSSRGNTVFDISKLTLMTPADFLSKKGTCVAEIVVNRDSDLTPRTVPSTVVSECISVASTPRVLYQNTDHNHPLSETRSFRMTDFKEHITPRSTSSVTPRDQLSSCGFDTHSTQMRQKEIITIRNKLKSFDEKKKKLR